MCSSGGRAGGGVQCRKSHVLRQLGAGRVDDGCRGLRENSDPCKDGMKQLTTV